MRILSSILALLGLSCISPSCLAAADLLKDGSWELFQPAQTDAAMATPSTNGLQLTVNRAVEPYHDIQASRLILPAVAKDHLIRLRFRAKSATNNPITVVVQQAVSPWTVILHTSPHLGADWQSFELKGDSPGYGPGGLTLCVQVGQQAGVVELADISLEDLGVDPELATARAAIDPAAAVQRIGRIRTGMMKIEVRDGDGHPIPGANLKISETRSEFLFGANIFPLQPDNTDPMQLEFRRRFTDLLNYATLPVYWSGYEPQRGQPKSDLLRARAMWCRDHGIEVKAHPLVWQQEYPAWAPRTADAAIPVLHERVTQLVGGFRDVIHRWDVVNEANAATKLPKTGVGQWALRDGPAAIVETALGWARDAGAGAPETFIYNDFDITDSNIQLLSKLKVDGKLPDVIGIQSHMHTGNWPLEKVWYVVDEFSQFGVPIHFTEVTVLSGEHRASSHGATRATDWKSTAAGESEQADYLVKFYSLLFSHPNVQAITYWDLGDHNAWKGAPAGLLRDDMTPKPAYDRLMRLIHHDWWTTADVQCGPDGNAATRAFFGQYEITVTNVSGSVTTAKVDYPSTSAEKPIVITVR
jgi:endo-1,4-beta-xylanase